jgi:hypothetical protein
VTARPIAWEFAAGLARQWVDWYTRLVGVEAAERRRAEIASDLWEQQAEAHRTGTPTWRLSLSITRRVLHGMAADLTWVRTQRSAAAGWAIPLHDLTRLAGRWWRAVGAVLLAACYLFVSAQALLEPGQPYLASAILAIACTALLIAGSVLSFRAPRLAGVVIAVGAAPAMLAWWAPGVAALSVLMAIRAIADVAGLTTGGGTPGRATAVAAGLVLVFASFGTVLLGWGNHWPLIGLGSVVVIGFTTRRRPALQ